MGEGKKDVEDKEKKKRKEGKDKETGETRKNKYSQEMSACTDSIRHCGQKEQKKRYKSISKGFARLVDRFTAVAADNASIKRAGQARGRPCETRLIHTRHTHIHPKDDLGFLYMLLLYVVRDSGSGTGD